PLGDPIPAEIKEERYKQFMLIQETISLAKNQTLIGKTLDVLVEGQDKGVSFGRSYRDAPEIDGYVVINDKAPVGQIVPVLIGGAMPHDLNGTLAADNP
ncbi:MAG: TRAM domain-containing protein, partial [Bellilinea sp.]